MNNENLDAQHAINELRQFHERLEDLMKDIDQAKNRLSPEKISEMQEYLKKLKEDLKSAAKRQITNKYEDAFTNPAITKAAAHLTARVNSHPINSNWMSSLYNSSINISSMLYQLEEQINGK